MEHATDWTSLEWAQAGAPVVGGSRTPAFQPWDRWVTTFPCTPAALGKEVLVLQCGGEERAAGLDNAG